MAAARRRMPSTSISGKCSKQILPAACHISVGSHHKLTFPMRAGASADRACECRTLNSKELSGFAAHRRWVISSREAALLRMIQEARRWIRIRCSITTLPNFAPTLTRSIVGCARKIRSDWGMPFEPNFEGAWHIANYADVNAMLKDPRLGKAAEADERMAALPIEAQEYLGMPNLALLRADPPDHTRLRALVSKAFTPRMVENLRPRIEAIATTLLDKADGAPRINLIDQYAFPLSITVITEMLGLTYDDREQLKHWAAILVAAQECKRTPEIYGPAAQASAEVVAFFHRADRAPARASASRHLERPDRRSRAG